MTPAQVEVEERQEPRVALLVSGRDVALELPVQDVPEMAALDAAADRAVVGVKRVDMVGKIPVVSGRDHNACSRAPDQG